MQISVGIYFLLEAPASWWAEALLCSGMAQAGLLGGRRWLGRGGRWPWWSAGPRCQQLGKWTLQRRSWAWRPGSLLWWLLRASLPRARSGRSRSCCVGEGRGAAWEGTQLPPACRAPGSAANAFRPAGLLRWLWPLRPPCVSTPWSFEWAPSPAKPCCDSCHSRVQGTILSKLERELPPPHASPLAQL